MYKLHTEKITESNPAGNELLKHFVGQNKRQKRNTFIGIFGKGGAGKSMAALKMAEILNPNFDVRKQVIYNPFEYLVQIDQAVEDEKISEIILDEAHVTVPPEMW